MMELDEFRKQCGALYDWINAETGRVFWINRYLGYGLSTNNDKLIIWEDDGGERGDRIEILPENVESMGFSDDDYQFQIAMDDGQGYDIEAYELLRLEFPAEEGRQC